MFDHPSIYKLDSKGKTRIWYQQQDGSRYRTIAGIEGGNLVESGWTTCVGKQGRTDVQQATGEIISAYEHKLTREYHRTRDTIHSGAHFFKPMLAEKYESVTFPVFTQPKLDGIRCIATKDGMFSREGKPIPGAGHIEEALASVFAENPELIFDGELYNHLFKDNFNEIVRLVKQKPNAERAAEVKKFVQYHVYDMPSSDGTFNIRTRDLNRILTRLDSPYVLYLDTLYIATQAELDMNYGRWLSEGYEGQMVRLNALYEQKQSKSLLKRKEFIDEEFKLKKIIEGTGNWAGAAKSVLCETVDGLEFGAGIKGPYNRGVELLNESHSVVTVRYPELTPDGVPRFGIATKFHGDERVL